MAPSARPSLSTALVVLCEDVFFAITAARLLSADSLRALARRRAPLIAGLPAEHQGGLMVSWEPWITSLCAAIAPIAPPRWMPMAEAVEMGLSLQHGARGVRSLFTSKPSEKEILRVRTVGSLAVRVLAAVVSAPGTFTPEDALMRAATVASLGLPEEDQRTLNNEAPIRAEALEIYGDVEPKLARAIVLGAFQAAMADGLDPREEDAVLQLSTKLNVPVEAVNDARNQAKLAIDRGKALGEACVDAIRYVLGDDLQTAERFGIAAARLTLAPAHRRDAITALNVGGHVTLGKKHSLERKEREAALGVAWAAALSSDPTYARRVELMSRHDRVALDLGDRDGAADVRATLERHLDAELLQVAAMRDGAGAAA